MSEADHVVIGVQERILTIRLIRGEKKNALTFAMYTAMTEALAKAAGDPGVRVVLITGTPDCFTAGNDLSGLCCCQTGRSETFN